jgi:hypothetical protein
MAQVIDLQNGGSYTVTANHNGRDTQLVLVPNKVSRSALTKLCKMKPRFKFVKKLSLVHGKVYIDLKLPDGISRSDMTDDTLLRIRMFSDSLLKQAKNRPINRHRQRCLKRAANRRAKQSLVQLA